MPADWVFQLEANHEQVAGAGGGPSGLDVRGQVRGERLRNRSKAVAGAIGYEARMAFHFPNESPAYRKARNKLLTAEMDLRRRVEAVAKLRRSLPLGGEVPEDYVFDEGRPVRLSQLFGDKKSLVLYSYMYGPKMKAPCPMCTSFLDAIEGNAQHIEQTVALAVAAKSPIARIRAFARGRGWKRLRLLSSAKSTYHQDYFGESGDGDQMPMANVFVKRGKKVLHFWASELLDAHGVDGVDSRHIDMAWPLWNVLDWTPEGRGKSWYPSLRYR